ncbi:MAG: peptide deformylase, partial [Chloroflexi bacterium]|nr:peptide deformylase [Chloroflexota bacterium]
MAVREILQIPHPVLRQRARKVRAIDDDILRIAYDMVDTMRNASGVGLAANQVGELLRVIVIQ